MKNPTLLAHLLPRVTDRIEDSATDALAFVLNKSEACRGALDRLLEWERFQPGPIVRVATQVAEDDQSRPDMVGYDGEGRKRMLVEAKFWAGLGKEQASGYLGKLDRKTDSVLLFICPASRIRTLWPEIVRQLEAVVKLEQLDASKGSRRAKVVDAGQHVILTSWRGLLDSFSAAVPTDSAVRSDIRQLRGLARHQDEEAFLPIHSQELGPATPRRIRGIHRLIDDLVRRGKNQGWITARGLRVTPQREGYGRYFAFSGHPGALFLGIRYELWVRRDETPLWLRVGRNVRLDREKLRQKAPTLADYIKRGPFWVPLHLPTGVEYQAVLDNVVRQVQVVRSTVKQTPIDS